MTDGANGIAGKGIVVKGIGGFYFVYSSGKIYRCKARGKLRRSGRGIVVGDSVSITIVEDEVGDSLVTEVDERLNSFIRPPISNVDKMLIVVSVHDPKPNLHTIDKLLVASEGNGVEPVLCINKVDLAKDDKIAETLSKLMEIYSPIYETVQLSNVEAVGIHRLKEIICDQKVALAGPSGTGKSTILNSLDSGIRAETGSVSEKIGRGRHTTRHVEIFLTDFGAMVYDTPGFTSIELMGIEPSHLQNLYPEMREVVGMCKYDNCSHTHEPDCRVIEMIEDGRLSESRYSSYKEQLKDLVIKDRIKRTGGI